MTKNQIDYQSFLENRRHNYTSEAETLRHNTQQESIGYTEAETHRQSLDISRRANEIGYLNALANQSNAASNAQNAASNAQNAATNAAKQAFEERKWDSPMGLGDQSATGVIKTITDVVTGVGRFIKFVQEG